MTLRTQLGAGRNATASFDSELATHGTLANEHQTIVYPVKHHTNERVIAPLRLNCAVLKRIRLILGHVSKCSSTSPNLPLNLPDG